MDPLNVESRPGRQLRCQPRSCRDITSVVQIILVNNAREVRTFYDGIWRAENVVMREHDSGGVRGRNVQVVAGTTINAHVCGKIGIRNPKSSSAHGTGIGDQITAEYQLVMGAVEC